jgi:hypothetical protein
VDGDVGGNGETPAGRLNRLTTLAADLVTAELDSQGDDQTVWNLIDSAEIADEDLPKILSAVVWVASPRRAVSR